MSMATQEVFNEISDLVESFKNEHEKNADGKREGEFKLGVSYKF